MACRWRCLRHAKLKLKLKLKLKEKLKLKTLRVFGGAAGASSGDKRGTILYNWLIISGEWGKFMATDKPAVWSGFWPRLIAYVADTLVLGVVCYAIGMVAIDYFAALGSNGRVVGLVLGTLYFGLTGSEVFGGRSIGMRILGLKVIGLNGRPLGVAAAFGRALFLVGPLMLNNWFFDISDPLWARVFGVVATTAVLGVCLAQIYLLLFNWPTRRLVHDLLFGAVVVRADAKDTELPKGRVHAIVAALLVLAALGLSLGGAFLMKSAMPKLVAAIGPLQRVQAAVEAVPDVREVNVQDNTSFVSINGAPATTTRTLLIRARVARRPADPDQTLANIGAAAAKTYAFAPDQHLRVQIDYGFDLGFATYTTSQASPYDPHCTAADVKCLVD